MGPRPQDASLCRRNGEVGLSGMAIADITLLSGFHALRADLEKVWLAAQRVPLSPREPCPSTAAPPAAEPCRVLSLVACCAQGHLPMTISLSSQLTSLSDRYVSHFETEGPHVLLYFDSVSRGTGGPGLLPTYSAISQEVLCQQPVRPETMCPVSRTSHRGPQRGHAACSGQGLSPNALWGACASQWGSTGSKPFIKLNLFDLRICFLF